MTFNTFINSLLLSGVLFASANAADLREHHVTLLQPTTVKNRIQFFQKIIDVNNIDPKIVHAKKISTLPLKPVIQGPYQAITVSAPARAYVETAIASAQATTPETALDEEALVPPTAASKAVELTVNTLELKTAAQPSLLKKATSKEKHLTFANIKKRLIDNKNKINNASKEFTGKNLGSQLSNFIAKVENWVDSTEKLKNLSVNEFKDFRNFTTDASISLSQRLDQRLAFLKQLELTQPSKADTTKEPHVEITPSITKEILEKALKSYSHDFENNLDDETYFLDLEIIQKDPLESVKKDLQTVEDKLAVEKDQRIRGILIMSRYNLKTRLAKLEKEERATAYTYPIFQGTIADFTFDQRLLNAGDEFDSDGDESEWL